MFAGYVTVLDSDSDTLVMGNRAKSRSRPRQKVSSAEARPKQQPIRKVRRRSRSRQTSREPPINPWTDGDLAPYTPYDSGTLECLRQGATDDERKENCRVMEEKMRRVQYAIDNPEKLPETKELAKKRVKWLKKQIAKENEMLALSKERWVKEWIKDDKKMERQRTRRYEQVDAEHRKRFPDEEENADAQRRRFERYNQAENDHRLMLTDQRCPGPIQTPQKNIDRIIGQSAAAVAASSSSSSSSSLTPQQPTRPPPQHLLRTVGVITTGQAPREASQLVRVPSATQPLAPATQPLRGIGPRVPEQNHEPRSRLQSETMEKGKGKGSKSGRRMTVREELQLERECHRITMEALKAAWSDLKAAANRD